MTRPVTPATQLKQSVANLLAQRQAAKVAAEEAAKVRDAMAAEEAAQRGNS